MRKTVQEWLDANNHATGPAKKKLARLKRLKRFPSTSTESTEGLPSIESRAKKNRDGAKRRRPK